MLYLQHNIYIKFLIMKIKITFASVIAFMAIMFCSCSDVNVAPGEVPAQINTFVQQYFPGQNVTFAQKDWSWFAYEYEVTLADGTHMEFDRDNQWKKIESPVKGVPASLLPAPIATYLNTNNPGIAVKKIDKGDRGEIEVELINNLELKFTEQGALMEMDD